MTDPEQPDQPAGTDSRPHGRPRPTEVVDRDTKVMDYLRAQQVDGVYVGKTRKEIAEGSGVDEKQVYLSLYRLSRTGQIARGEGHRWAVKTA